ncbi:MAG: cell division protein ZapA [Bacteroidetes bacterium]|nr:MAG: cell division protein ZapA [Bacteroidota bacterium]
MKGQHISVIIADRPYRLTVRSEKEETEFRQAGDLINTKIKEYANHFAFRDKQDLLAMVVLQFAVDVVKSEESSEYQQKLGEKLSELEKTLDDYLKK